LLTYFAPTLARTRGWGRPSFYLLRPAPPSICFRRGWISCVHDRWALAQSTYSRANGSCVEVVPVVQPAGAVAVRDTKLGETSPAGTMPSLLGLGCPEQAARTRCVHHARVGGS
jgi:hypothetical protein